jgi:tetratricopeptide (TPR) repeat protein
VLAEHPEFAPALQGIPGALLAMERAEEATPYLLQLLARAANPADAAMVESALGNALQLQGQLENALTHSRRALALKLDMEGLHASQGDILEQLGRIEDAIRLYRDRLMREPSDLAAHARLNTLLFRLGREGEFLASFDAAMARLPRSTALQTAKADFLLLAGRLQDAEECFSRALRFSSRISPPACRHPSRRACRS